MYLGYVVSLFLWGSKAFRGKVPATFFWLTEPQKRRRRQQLSAIAHMDVNNDSIAVPEEEVDLEIDDVKDGTLDLADDDDVEDLVLYRGAWFVSPLNVRQETGALIRFVGAVSRPNDGGERLVVRYLSSSSPGKRISLADNLLRICVLCRPWHITWDSLMPAMMRLEAYSPMGEDGVAGWTMLW